MIIDQLENLSNYIPCLPPLKTVVGILHSGELTQKAFGSYTTDDKRVRYNLFSYTTEQTEPKLYEVHRKEALFVRGKKLVSYHADTSTFAIFFPSEPHAPNLVDTAPSTVTKVVFKILVEE